MYLMYVDESGDIGTNNSPTQYFILSAIIIHESKWRDVLDRIKIFRRQLKTNYGLLINEEIHAAVFAGGRAKIKNSIPSSKRIQILLDCLDFLASLQDLISIITIRVDKQKCAIKGQSVFEYSWQVLIQRFENTLTYNNFPLPFTIPLRSITSRYQRGLLLTDNTDGGKLRKQLRKMRYHNMVPSVFPGYPSRNLPVKLIIEDQVMRDSKDSYLHQMADVVAYFAKQYYNPSKAFLSRQIDKEYNKLTPVINTAVSKNKSNNYIVEV